MFQEKIQWYFNPRIVPNIAVCFYSERHARTGLTEGTEDWYFPSFAHFRDLVFESRDCLNHLHLKIFALPPYAHFPSFQSLTRSKYLICIE